MAKLITVFGATGNQGGSVVRSLLKDQGFKVRGITRNVESDKAKALTTKGVEMVKASMDDVTSLESALSGSYGVFGVTNYWEVFDQAKEAQMGKNIVDTAKKVGVQHVVFSGLQSIKKLTGMTCPHFEGKAEVEEYLFQSGVPGTSVRYAAYMENIFSDLKPYKVGDGQYVWNVPMEGKPMDMISASNAGGAVAAIFKNPEKYNGKAIGLTGDRKTIAEYCDIISKVAAPVKISASPITAEEFGKLGFPGADDLSAMFAFYQTEHPDYSVQETKSLDPETKDFETYLQENKEKLVALFQQ